MNYIDARGDAGMSDQAPAPLYDDPEYISAAGMFAMTLLSRRWKFTIHDGGRRMLSDRSPGAATLTSIQGDKK